MDLTRFCKNGKQLRCLNTEKKISDSSIDGSFNAADSNSFCRDCFSKQERCRDHFPVSLASVLSSEGF